MNTKRYKYRPPRSEETRAKIRAAHIKRKTGVTHGLSEEPLYTVWDGMKSRCTKTNNKSYPRYGGRGIKICSRWMDVRNFFEDMSPSYVQGLQLDRIDNNGNYEPSNCRWVTRKQNANNTRYTLYIEYKGQRKPFREWCDEVDVPAGALWKRIYSYNWTIDRAFNTPVIQKIPKKKLTSLK